MLALILKTLHVLSAIVFLGTGAGSAWYKLRADTSGDVRVVAWAQREIVRADWIFTVPSAVLLPASGAALVHVYGLPWRTDWVMLGFAAYVTAGVTWLPAAFLQIRMRRLADEALAAGGPLPDAFHRDRRAWLALGFPSFLSAMAAIWVMVAKPYL